MERIATIPHVIDIGQQGIPYEWWRGNMIRRLYRLLKNNTRVQILLASASRWFAANIAPAAIDPATAPRWFSFVAWVSDKGALAAFVYIIGLHVVFLDTAEGRALLHFTKQILRLPYVILFVLPAALMDLLFREGLITEPFPLVAARFLVAFARGFAWTLWQFARGVFRLVTLRGLPPAPLRPPPPPPPFEPPRPRHLDPVDGAEGWEAREAERQADEWRQQWRDAEVQEANERLAAWHGANGAGGRAVAAPALLREIRGWIPVLAVLGGVVLAAVWYCRRSEADTWFTADVCGRSSRLGEYECLGPDNDAIRRAAAAAVGIPRYRYFADGTRAEIPFVLDRYW